MRFVRRSYALALIGAVVSWQPLAASAAWNFEKNGPHRIEDAAPAGAPQGERSLAPKPTVAMARPVAPSEAGPPEGVRSLAPKKGVAFARPVGPRSGEPYTEMPLVSD
jgi:hypothetical protein